MAGSTSTGTSPSVTLANVLGQIAAGGTSTASPSPTPGSSGSLEPTNLTLTPRAPVQQAPVQQAPPQAPPPQAPVQQAPAVPITPAAAPALPPFAQAARPVATAQVAPQLNPLRQQYDRITRPMFYQPTRQMMRSSHHQPFTDRRDEYMGNAMYPASSIYPIQTGGY